jgi:hypothetical protein
VVRVPFYRSRGSGSISGVTRFSGEVVVLERGPLSLVSTIEELLERERSSSGLESLEYEYLRYFLKLQVRGKRLS